MLLERRRKGVEPMRRANEKFQGFARRDILDADRHDRNALMHRPLDLALDLWRAVGVARKHQHHHPRAVDRADDRLRPAYTRHNIARGHPDADAVSLQRVADRVGGCLVLIRIGKKNVMRHGVAPAV
jgi:hypothetical protein